MTVTKHFLKLEPIGLSLVIFFSVIQVVQFIAMLFHRISTFMQTMASTTFTKKVNFGGRRQPIHDRTDPTFTL